MADAGDLNRNLVFQISRSGQAIRAEDAQLGATNEFERVRNDTDGSSGTTDSAEKQKEKAYDQKTLRRLAQNREAARKSRLRKKAYVQQLESSRLQLVQLQQELQAVRKQGTSLSISGDPSSASRNGAAVFDIIYARWVEEHAKLIAELRRAVNGHAGDIELRVVIDDVMAHLDDIVRLKAIAAKTDSFHLLSGTWKSPAERCSLWIGGFRPSEILKLIVNQLEPLTEQQMADIYNLQQSSLQAEDAVSQGLEALQLSLAETVAKGSPVNIANYMGQMAMAMGKLGTVKEFLCQADSLRQQILQQMDKILTARQYAQALVAIHDFYGRLQALSNLWLARPHE